MGFLFRHLAYPHQYNEFDIINPKSYFLLHEIMEKYKHSNLSYLWTLVNIGCVKSEKKVENSIYLTVCL